jgi:hypothetical protein
MQEFSKQALRLLFLVSMMIFTSCSPKFPEKGLINVEGEELSGYVKWNTEKGIGSVSDRPFANCEVETLSGDFPRKATVEGICNRNRIKEALSEIKRQYSNSSDLSKQVQWVEQAIVTLDNLQDTELAAAGNPTPTQTTTPVPTATRTPTPTLTPLPTATGFPQQGVHAKNIGKDLFRLSWSVGQPCLASLYFQKNQLGLSEDQENITTADVTGTLEMTFPGTDCRIEEINSQLQSILPNIKATVEDAAKNLAAELETSGQEFEFPLQGSHAEQGEGWRVLISWVTKNASQCYVTVNYGGGSYTVYTSSSEPAPCTKARVRNILGSRYSAISDSPLGPRQINKSDLPIHERTGVEAYITILNDEIKKEDAARSGKLSRQTKNYNANLEWVNQIYQDNGKTGPLCYVHLEVSANTLGLKYLKMIIGTRNVACSDKNVAMLLSAHPAKTSDQITIWITEQLNKAKDELMLKYP